MSALFTIRKQCGMTPGMYITHIHLQHKSVSPNFILLLFFKENINKDFLWAVKIILLFMFFFVASIFSAISTIFITFFLNKIKHNRK